MKEIQLTQGQVAIVDDADFEWLNQWKWQARWCRSIRGFYVQRGVRNSDGRQTILAMHRVILGVTNPKTDVDHIDHNGLNNQRSNLRPASRSQNNMNSRKRQRATSKYKGVDWDKSRRRWRAQIKRDSRTIQLGRFKNELDAALAYRHAAMAYDKQFAFIPGLSEPTPAARCGDQYLLFV